MSTLEEIKDELVKLRRDLGGLNVQRPFLRLDEAAELARCHLSMIERLIAAGRLSKAGVSRRRVLVRRDELVKLLEAGDLDSPADQAQAAKEEHGRS